MNGVDGFFITVPPLVSLTQDRFWLELLTDYRARPDGLLSRQAEITMELERPLKEADRHMVGDSINLNSLRPTLDRIIKETHGNLQDCLDKVMQRMQRDGKPLMPTEGESHGPSSQGKSQGRGCSCVIM